jgi:Mg-chelatase subunit ChlI
MALSKKLVKAVKEAQKQAEATVAEVREAIDGTLPDLNVNVDPTPFYAVVGAANIAVDTIRNAAEQLEAARKQTKTADLRKGARKEAAELQKDLQKRVTDLQKRTTELQQLATQFADRFVAQAQDLPAHVLNQGLVLASNAKDQYDAAAVRGARVVGDLRSHGEQSLDAAVDSAREQAADVAGRVEEVASDAQDAVAPEKPARPARSDVKKASTDKASAPKSSTKKATPKKASTKKSTATKSSGTKSSGTKSTAKATTAKATTAKTSD